MWTVIELESCVHIPTSAVLLYLSSFPLQTHTEKWRAEPVNQWCIWERERKKRILKITVSLLCIQKYLKAESHWIWLVWLNFHLSGFAAGVFDISVLAPYAHFCFQIHCSSVIDKTLACSPHMQVREHSLTWEMFLLHPCYLLFTILTLEPTVCDCVLVRGQEGLFASAMCLTMWIMSISDIL